ncbi:CPBP family intramembrane glutamic endopeptidase [Alcanivorax sp. 1008]|uniref:CPBP family intramembrane glutamic endopeptidase n=1 Tax=Alcanivorax sp. 1008 TaxID=2816853 RepID=UPI001D9EFD15|nr:CPBP family intramembrane glutamic endopeptidase [Alcanivorax sp. 1008]MCC1495897.1 CPBP family intramembrane metalloprotease [Alcanivorax sp. 1008]
MAAGSGLLTPIRNLLQQPLPTAVDHRRMLIVAVVTSVALIINHYLAIQTSLGEGLQWFANLTDQSVAPWFRWLRQSPWGTLSGHAWWGMWLLIGYVLVPVLAIKLLLRESPMEYGLRLNDVLHHWRYYAIFGGIMAGMAILASFNSTFLNTYPFYHLAGRSWTDLLLWELIYVMQFFCIEFFYRGFLLRGLQPSLGIGSIYVSSLVYLTIHLPKPFLECAGSLLFGLILCVLASLSRSIWGGVFVHVCLAVSMDLLSLFQRGQLPGQ